MALTVDLTQTDIGTAVPGAYLRILKFEGDKYFVRVHVEAHVNAQARDEERLPVLRTTHGIESANVTGVLLPALYAALKTLPQYAGAQDC